MAVLVIGRGPGLRLHMNTGPGMVIGRKLC